MPGVRSGPDERPSIAAVSTLSPRRRRASHISATNAPKSGSRGPGHMLLRHRTRRGGHATGTGSGVTGRGAATGATWAPASATAAPAITQVNGSSKRAA